MTSVTFVLPHGGAAGGVRVTVEMARQLMERAYNVRVAYRKPPVFTKEAIEDGARLALRRLKRSKDFDWLQSFKGNKQAFIRLNDLAFVYGEVVIAIGEHTVKDVYELGSEVLKLRYCHCIFDHLPELNNAAWGVPMNTIAVSPSMVAPLGEYSGSKVLAVVPNGIHTSEYYADKCDRDGIGLVFRDIPQKGPDIAKAILGDARCRFRVPWHMFGTSRRPREFGRDEYQQYPSVAQARGIYNRCKIWLVTSRDEGFCLPILEAMACGCAVISSNHLVAGDLIEDGVNGFIVPYGDLEAYARRIAFLLADEDARRNIVAKSRETVEQFTWRAAADKMEQALILLKAQTAFQSEGVPC